LLLITVSSSFLSAPSLEGLEGTRLERPLAQIGLVNSQRFSDQESRISNWMQSVSFLDLSPPLVILFGDGIGTGGGPYSAGITVRSHGESSFIQSLFEGGITGTILRLLPFYIAQASFLRLTLQPKWVSLASARINYTSIIKLSSATILILFMINSVAPLMVYLPIHMYIGWMAGRMFRLAHD